MKEYAVRTDQLQKVFKNKKALDNVSIHVEKGSIYGLIGRNGAGKTTIMKTIIGLSYPNSGEIFLFGENIKDNKKNRTKIGNLIENPGLYPQMTAFENMYLKATAMGVYKKDTVEELLKLACLENVGKKKVRNFSLGMKQRLGIAMALIGSPDMLILDEPTNGLDPQGISEMREFLLKLCHERNMTILISSHILDELSKIATHYGIINHGNLITELTAEELNQKCTAKLEIITTDAAAACKVLDEMNIQDYKVIDDNTVHIFSSLDQSMEINRKLVHANVPVQYIQKKCDTLEEYFLKTTADGSDK